MLIFVISWLSFTVRSTSRRVRDLLYKGGGGILYYVEGMTEIYK